MKKLMFAAVAASLFGAYAQEAAESAPVAVPEPAPAVQEAPAPAPAPAVQEPAPAPAPAPTADDIRDAAAEEECDWPFWGFGNYGFYSGYQLYGSLVNPEPTLQGYVELNANLSVDDVSLGYLGGGIWSNTDLTDRRRNSYGKAFNEWDFNVHWGYTFWFDDEQKVGLAYRTSVVWYYYPHRRHDHKWGSTATTVDWNHYVELVNPYIIPFANFVHEYHESDGNLIEFGVKKPLDVCEKLTVVPSATFVWRNSNYGWCFPNYGYSATGKQIGSGIATMKLMLDATYKITENFGFFAKLAYCHIVDEDLRDAAEAASGQAYGKYKDFAWGGVGVCFNF